MSSENDSPVLKHLVEANTAYGDSFTHGDLALPPSKKYLVGKDNSLTEARLLSSKHPSRYI